MRASQHTNVKAIKTIGAVLGTLLSTVYLSNIGFGVAELIPDNIPVAGNLDELLASLLLIRSLLYLGLDPIALKDLAKRQLQKEEEDAELEKNTIDVEIEE